MKKLIETPPLHSKLRGELAELRFMTRAAELGLRVIKPWGDSSRYDFVVETGSRFLRVQVKATSTKQDNSYYRHLRRGRQPPYTAAEVDFIAAFIIPKDIWYIIPMTAVGKATHNLVLSPHMEVSKHGIYEEAWHLLR